MKGVAVIEKATSTAGKFGSATAGAFVGGVIVSKIPALDFLKKVPGVGEWLAKLAPGILVMVLAYVASTRFKNDYVESGAMGMGLMGFVDMLRKTGILAKLNTALPGSGLNGIGIVQNNGAYSPDYFLKSNWATRPLNGGDAQAFSLQGSDAQAFSLQGQDRQAFSLQGTKGMGCMYQ